MLSMEQRHSMDIYDALERRKALVAYQEKMQMLNKQEKKKVTRLIKDKKGLVKVVNKKGKTIGAQG